MRSLEASLCFWERGCQRKKRCGGRIFMRGCRQQAWERKNRSTSARGSTRNGRLAHRHEVPLNHEGHEVTRRKTSTSLNFVVHRVLRFYLRLCERRTSKGAYLKIREKTNLRMLIFH